MGKLIDQIPDSGTLARQVLEHFKKLGQHGAIVDEVAESLGLLHQRVSPTVSALKMSGFLEPKGQAKRQTATGSHATVYVITRSFTLELVSAGLMQTYCYCSNRLHPQLHPFCACPKPAEMVLTFTNDEVRPMCLECAVEIPSTLIKASRSIGDRQK